MKLLSDFTKHFDYGYSDNIKLFSREEALKHSRYIFLSKKDNGYYEGYCTYCKKTFIMPKAPHKTMYICQHCNGTHEVRHTQYSRSKMVDKVYFTYFEKSKCDETKIVARGILVERDYSGSYFNIKDNYITKAYYVLEYGKGAWSAVNHDAGDALDMDYWVIKSAMSDINSKNPKIGKFNIGAVKSSVTEVVSDTMFKYSDWEGYAERLGTKADIVGYLILIAKYPSTEYLYKVGLVDALEARMKNTALAKRLNWRGKSLPEVLKLPKHRVKELVTSGISLTNELLYILHKYEAENYSYNILDLEDQAKLFERGHLLTWDYAEKITKYVPLHKLYTYIKKQERFMGTRRINIFSYYADYLDECKLLNLDLTAEKILYPKDLYKAHERTMIQVREQKEPYIQQGIAKRIKELPVYNNGLYLVKPIESHAELVKEGAYLNHCVASYGKKYAIGDCDLYAVRAVTSLDVPLVTMEVRDGRLVQARGVNNSDPSLEVIKIINKFLNELPKLKRSLKIVN